MKHYMDIENLRENDISIGDIIRKSNATEFEVGDIIQITEKYDGANASIENIDGELHYYSHNKELNIMTNTLNGFINYIDTIFNITHLLLPENIIVFGEWSGARNRIVYDVKKTWLVFDIYDRTTESYWNQKDVREFCNKYKFNYIHEFYYGPFISWEHCRSFMNSPKYGDKQEGIICKNQSKLTTAKNNYYLKIVNDDFKETMTKKPKVVDLEKMSEKQKSYDLMSTIVTEARVEKMLYKLRDENIIPSEISPQDIGMIAKVLPKRIFEDCMKEESDTVRLAGEYAGKDCSAITMKIARKIILG